MSTTNKPERQRAAGVAPMIDGILTKRVQTLGSSIDITREEAQELANSGVVQYVTQAPVVSIQIDTNNVGSTDNLALLTDKMITYTQSDVKDDPRGGFGFDFKHSIVAGSSNSVARTITEQDLLQGYCSITATLNEEGTAAARTLWMNHCAVTGLTMSFDVNGNATENYTLSADNKTWFFNDWANVRCYKPLFNQISTGRDTANARGITFVGLASCVPDGSTVVAIGINNTILRQRGSGVTGNATFFPIGGPATGTGGTYEGSFHATTYALSTPFVSTSSNSTDRVWIIFKPSGARTWESTADTTTGPGWELESTGGAIGAIRRGYVTAYLYNTAVDSKATYSAAGKALRLQTITIDVALGEEQLFELGTDGFYGISKNTPVPVTVTVTANDSDLEYFTMMAATSVATTVKTITAEDFSGTNNLRLEVYADKAKTIPLQYITCGNMSVQSENFNVAVGGNASNEFAFTCDNITLVGTGVNVTGGFYGAL